MTRKLNPPVPATTKGGHSGRIVEVDPNDEDCLIGEVDVQHGHRERRWNRSGICRDSPPELNIDPSTQEIKDLLDSL